MSIRTNLQQWLRDGTQRISNRARSMNTARINALWKQIKPQLHDFSKLPYVHICEMWKILLEAVKVIAGCIFIFALLLLLSAAISMPRECTELHLVCYLFGVEDKATALRNLGFVMAGILSFAGIVIAHERSQAMADTAKASYEAVKATTAGQQQERFRDAIAHLGNEKASVRQGGAHALFHLALDEERLRASIADILCAYIRETTQSKDYQKAYEDKPSTEIQSLLEMLFVEGRTEEENKKLDDFWKDITPNLVGCYFQGTELRVAQFRKADLRRAQFQEARLIKAQFQKALLAHSQFQGSDLEDAQFQEAFLDHTQFQGSNLYGAKFQGARLRKAKFQGADLISTQFQRADLGDAQFQKTELWHTEFQVALLDHAQFQGAKLYEVQFQKAWLAGAKFMGTRLRVTQFQGAYLGEAQFQGAQCDNVQFQGADLGNTQFQGVFRDTDGRGLCCCEKRIRGRIDCETELNSVVFSGGLDDNQVEKVVAELKKVLEVPEQKRETRFTAVDIEIFKEEMKEHVGKPKNHTPPDSVITGKYSGPDAEKWIEECPAACAQQVPESGEDS